MNVMMIAAWALPLLSAYLIGSVPFGLILGKLAGIGDIRTIGSGNIGATNMLRTGKRGLALATLVCDIGKGTLAVWLCDRAMRHYLQDMLMPEDMLQYDYLLAICAVLGHVFPVWLKFKGGKGVATALGVMIGLSPWIAACVAALWLIVFYCTRYSSLSAIVALTAAPVIAFFLVGQDFALTALVLALIIILKHKENLVRLKNGTESKWVSKHATS